MMRFEDLTDQVFGRLTVEHRTAPRTRGLYGPPRRLSDEYTGKTWWACRCTCGRSCKVTRTGLMRGKRSCGCLQQETRVANGQARRKPGERYPCGKLRRRPRAPSEPRAAAG